MSLICCGKIHHTPSSSHTMTLLNAPAHSKATIGDLSFSSASSFVWNSIPDDVRCAPSLPSFKVSFEDILVSFSLQRMNSFFDHFTYVHGLLYWYCIYIYILYNSITCIGLVIDLLTAFLKNALMCIFFENKGKYQIKHIVIVCPF